MQARKLAAAPAPLSLSMCHAYTYDDVPPLFVSPKDKNCWNIEEEADHITLLFNVGEMNERSAEEGRRHDLPPPPPSPPASKLDVRLLLPSGYAEDPEKKVKAELTLDRCLGDQIKIIVPPPSSNPAA
ncbi:hypothetical protein HU200_013670 [Digitaria exilis]|uniref:SHSP domain-containing protein n=1 Tax=Digitaria exilis TaxID=1010633 RepID=A0A835KKW1_9POAL|nr:hypothetical protein HU200_013670 [Digitaria exilis]